MLNGVINKVITFIAKHCILADVTVAHTNIQSFYISLASIKTAILTLMATFNPDKFVFIAFCNYVLNDTTYALKVIKISWCIYE